MRKSCIPQPAQGGGRGQEGAHVRLPPAVSRCHHSRVSGRDRVDLADCDRRGLVLREDEVVVDVPHDQLAPGEGGASLAKCHVKVRPKLVQWI